MALPRDDNSDLARSLISPDAVYGPRASNLSSQRSSVVMRATSGGATGGEGAKGEKGNKYDALNQSANASNVPGGMPQNPELSKSVPGGTNSF